MALWKRSNGVWYYGFSLAGRYYQASSFSKSKTMARDAMQVRRREVERGINGIARRDRVLTLKLAAKEWLETKSTSARNTYEQARHLLKPLEAEFGNRLVCDISAKDIATYQRKRLSQQAKNRKTPHTVSPGTVNHEVAALRQVLKSVRLWRNIQDDVKMLKEPKGPGRALSYDHEEKLIEAIKQGRSPALLPMFILTIDSGLRASEVRNLRYRDLNLTWTNGAIESGWLTVSKSKTEAGTGRTVPLTRRTCAELTVWLSRFGEGDAGSMKVIRLKTGPSDNYLFPFYKVGVSGNDRAAHAYGFNPEKPIGDWGKAWDGACRRATAKLKEDFGESAVGIQYRWHDLRHTFITRLAERPEVSEQTIMSLAGHVSKEMLARYSHIRAAAKQAAIATLERSESIPLRLVTVNPTKAA